MSLRFGLDLDGIAYDWSATARLLIKYHHGIDVGESTSWDHIQRNVPPEIWRWLWTKGVEKHGLFRHGDTYPNTFEALNDLNAMGWDIVVITSRPKAALIDTMGWLSFHRVQAREIHVLGPKANKSAITCDLYVDDKCENCQDTAGAGFRSLLWTRPWNVECDISGLAPLASRVSSWYDVLDVAKDMKEKG